MKYDNTDYNHGKKFAKLVSKLIQQHIKLAKVKDMPDFCYGIQDYLTVEQGKENVVKFEKRMKKRQK